MRATIASILFLLFLSAGGQTLIDSYPESNYSGTTNSYLGTRQCVGQSFTNPTACTLYSMKFQISRTGAASTGDVVCYLFAHTGTFGTNGVPTGSPLATSDAIDISTISAVKSVVEFKFTGANQYSMLAATPYYAIISYASGDAAKYLNVSYGPLGHAGTYSTSNNCSTAWSAPHASRDFIFYVYKVTVANDSPFYQIMY